MTELETQIWNTVHNWCDAQSNEIPDQNRRYLMDEIKALVLSHVSGSVCDQCTDGSGWYGCEDITYNCSKCNPEAN